MERIHQGGLLIGADAAAPFLLAARAQGDFAAAAGRGRAYFVEGLCSSYEAFHHTRQFGTDTRDVDDDGQEVPRNGVIVSNTRPVSIVPIDWYERQIQRLIPSKAESLAKRYAHPKVSAVVDAAVRLWLDGEKVLIFCFYRETAKALRAHLMRAVNRATTELLAHKLRLKQLGEIDAWIARAVRRLSDPRGTFYPAIRTFLETPLRQSQFGVLKPYSEELIGLLEAYVRSPAFIARYMPLDVESVRRALGEGS